MEGEERNENLHLFRCGIKRSRKIIVFLPGNLPSAAKGVKYIIVGVETSASYNSRGRWRIVDKNGVRVAHS